MVQELDKLVAAYKEFKKMRRLQYHQLIPHCKNYEKMKSPGISPDTIFDRRTKQGVIQHTVNFALATVHNNL